MEGQREQHEEGGREDNSTRQDKKNKRETDLRSAVLKPSETQKVRQHAVKIFIFTLIFEHFMH